jgi:hypothetical protein
MTQLRGLFDLINAWECLIDLSRLEIYWIFRSFHQVGRHFYWVFRLAEVIVSQDLHHFFSIIAEISGGVKSLRNDGNLVIESCSLQFSPDGSKVNFLLIDHNHHLPLVLVLRHSPIFRPSKLLFSHSSVKSLWFLLYNVLFWVQILYYGSTQFILNLKLLLKSLIHVELGFKTDL